MTLIKFSNKVIPKDNHTKIKQYNRTALKNLEKACELNPNNANLCYHLGLLKFGLQKTHDSISDIEKAMEKSEDKISFKFFHNEKHRPVGVHWFKKTRFMRFITLNLKIEYFFLDLLFQKIAI